MVERKNSQQQTTPLKNRGTYNSLLIESGVDSIVVDSDLKRVEEAQKTEPYDFIDQTWCPFFTEDYMYLKYMIATIDNSVTLRNVILQMTTLIVGDGFSASAKKRTSFLKNLLSRVFGDLSTLSVDELNEAIASVNINGESLEEVIEKVAFDYLSFGNAVVYFKKIEVGKTKKLNMHHAPLGNVAIKRNDDGVKSAIGLCDDWEDWAQQEIKEVPIYPTIGANGMTAIHIKNYSPNHNYWGIPSWIASGYWAEIEYRIAKYNISQLKNGFMPSAIMQLFGAIPEQDRRKLEQQLKDKYTGTGNGSQLLLNFVVDPEYAAKIELIKDESEGRFLELQKMATQSIVTSMGYTMSLSGVAQGGKLGTNQQIRDELEFVTNTAIKRVQRKIEQKILVPFMQLSSEVKPSLQGILLEIVTSSPLSLAGQLDPRHVLTLDEQRKVFGYGPSEEHAREDIDQQQETEE